MKKLILLALCLVASFYLPAQKFARQADGNYTQVQKPSTPPTATANFATDKKGNKYVVYTTARGAKFILRRSKSGKEYKQYLKD